MLDILKGPIQAVQEFYELTGRALRNVFRKPHYVDDILLQMDSIGVGSIPIVLLTGFFSGAVMALQMGRAPAAIRPDRPHGNVGFDHPGARTGSGADVA